MRLGAVSIAIAVAISFFVTTGQEHGHAATPVAAGPDEGVTSSVSASHDSTSVDRGAGPCEGDCTYFLPLVAHNYDPYLLASDDFSDPGSGWGQHESDVVRYAYRNGEYEIAVKRQSFPGRTIRYWWIGRPLPNYSISADARMQLGTEVGYGLAFNSTRDGDVYEFIIFERSGHTYYTVTYLNHVKWEWEAIVDWTESPHINTGGIGNHLRIDRRGDMLTLYINGHLLNSVKAQNGEETPNAGFVVVTYPDTPVPVVGRFDNIKLRRLAE